jgi:predicted amidohydrolase YtcJ
MADRLGRLEPGSYADLIVLDRDLYQTPAEEIASVLPRATMVAGQWAYPEGDPGL